MISVECIIAWVVLLAGTYWGTQHASRAYCVVYTLLCMALWVLFESPRLGSNATLSELAILLLGMSAVALLGLRGVFQEDLMATPQQAVHRTVSMPMHTWPTSPGLRNSILDRLGRAPTDFAEWLDQYRQHVDPWPAFEQYIRRLLQEFSRAQDVRAYRVLDEDHLLLPLGDADRQAVEHSLQVGKGIGGWVIQHQRPFFAFEVHTCVELQDVLARTPGDCACAIPVASGRNVVGVVTVGSFEKTDPDTASLMRLLAGLIADQWTCVTEMCRARVALSTDIITGLLHRREFLQAAPRVVERSKQQCTPVASAVFTVTGLDRLDELGYWGLRDQALGSIGKILRSRLTPDDCASRFDESRFVVIWTHVDSSRVADEVDQIEHAIRSVFQDRSRWNNLVDVRSAWTVDEPSRASFQSILSDVLSVERRRLETAVLAN